MENKDIFLDYLRNEIKNLEKEELKITNKITKENNSGFPDFYKLNKLMVEKEKIKFAITKLYQLIGGFNL